MNALNKIDKTRKYLNTKKLVLVYGELCRQANKNPDINFHARFECAKQLTSAGVKVKAFARYTKQGQTILASIKQESGLLAYGWTKIV